MQVTSHLGHRGPTRPWGVRVVGLILLGLGLPLIAAEPPQVQVDTRDRICTDLRRIDLQFEKYDADVTATEAVARLASVLTAFHERLHVYDLTETWEMLGTEDALADVLAAKYYLSASLKRDGSQVSVRLIRPNGETKDESVASIEKQGISRALADATLELLEKEYAIPLSSSAQGYLEAFRKLPWQFDHRNDRRSSVSGHFEVTESRIQRLIGERLGATPSSAQGAESFKEASLLRKAMSTIGIEGTPGSAFEGLERAELLHRDYRSHGGQNRAKLAEADKWLSWSVNQEPALIADPRYHLLRAQIDHLLGTRARQDILDDLQQALDVAPSFQLHFFRGYLLDKNLDVEAVREFVQAILDNPAFLRSYAYLIRSAGRNHLTVEFVAQLTGLSTPDLVRLLRLEPGAGAAESVQSVGHLLLHPLVMSRTRELRPYALALYELAAIVLEDRPEEAIELLAELEDRPEFYPADEKTLMAYALTRLPTKIGDDGRVWRTIELYVVESLTPASDEVRRDYLDTIETPDSAARTELAGMRVRLSAAITEQGGVGPSDEAMLGLLAARVEPDQREASEIVSRLLSSEHRGRPQLRLAAAVILHRMNKADARDRVLGNMRNKIP